MIDASCVVERLHEARRSVSAPIEVGHLFVQVVHARLKLGGAALELLALVANSVERVALGAQACVLLRVDRDRDGAEEADEQAEDA